MQIERVKGNFKAALIKTVKMLDATFRLANRKYRYDKTSENVYLLTEEGINKLSEKQYHSTSITKKIIARVIGEKTATKKLI
jgi:hypothetical protein